MTKIWNRLSLRQQFLLPITLMIIGALLSGVLALQIFSPNQFEYENEQETGSAHAVARALNASIAVSTNPQESLSAFAQNLGSSEAIKYLPSDARALPLAKVRSEGVPSWFSSQLKIPELSRIYPISIGAARVGSIVFVPDLSADIWEKWMGFLAIVFSSAIPMFLAASSAYLTAGLALQPLGRLGKGLTRMREGAYDTMIPVTGPLEIRKSCEEANQLAQALNRLSHDNRELLRRLVSLQDDERCELARELHDEMGPLLFAIRANVTALSEAAADDSCDVEPPAQGVFRAAEALQQANHRILDRLHPLYLQELGLVASLESLMRNFRGERSTTARLVSDVDPDVDGLEVLLCQTVYRVIQEGVTNALRHAKATVIDVSVAIKGTRILVEVSDDGIGLSKDMTTGRGLIGMSERMRALDGSLEIVRERDWTTLRCNLPVEQPLDKIPPLAARPT